ncbi:hypothetical protein B0J12DRAFT_696532 [Macrophomina phaseolina]|uniref:Uncharacterized protein n=1 Tax=Macrophomina phaseolina TaxID=35725 RepID=A0ABQ8GKC5_9PEZI|nr:hypothetical protein B0J12DRAFT_696532 [Macrophomina phaseolina]
MKLSCPTQGQSAVARGAAIRGLEGLMPSSRKSRRHYGYEIGMPFRHGIDPIDKRYREAWTGKMYCSEGMKWVVRKGQTIANNFNIEHDICLEFEGRKHDVQQKIRLFCCNSERPPEYGDKPTAEEIGVVHSKIPKKEIKYLPSKKKEGELIKMLETQIAINMASEQATLTVKNLLKGRDVGNATIMFHRD